MHLDPVQRRTLSANWSAFLKARRLTPSRVRQNYGMSYGTAKNLTDPAKYSSMTVPLIRRLTQLTNKSLKDLVTSRIDWPENGARGNGQHAKRRNRPRRKAQARPARRVRVAVLEARWVRLQLGKAEISVPEGVKVTVTGPRSLRIED